MDKLRVLVVDDSALYRKILTEAVEATGIAAVLETASNGVTALERLAKGTFEIVLLDVIMPEMDGIQTLRHIKRNYPQIDVIMISGMGGDNAAVTVEALEFGAMDFIVKPSGSDQATNLEFIKGYLKALFNQIRIKKRTSSQRTVPSETRKSPQLPSGTKSEPLTGVDLILVAASTGGPKALDVLFSGLPAGLKQPVLVVQHMPPDFTKVLAESLSRKSRIPVIEGRDNEPIVPGRIVIAPGGFHLTIQCGNDGNRFLKLNDGPTVNGVKPAADVLFNSAAEFYRGKNILTIVMTGMGNDGTQGIGVLKQHCRCYCIAQDEKSCVVFGMPKRVIDAGYSDETLALGDIAGRIGQLTLN